VLVGEVLLSPMPKAGVEGNTPQFVQRHATPTSSVSHNVFKELTCSTASHPIVLPNAELKFVSHVVHDLLSWLPGFKSVKPQAVMSFQKPRLPISRPWSNLIITVHPARVNFASLSLETFTKLDHAREAPGDFDRFSDIEESYEDGTDDTSIAGHSMNLLDNNADAGVSSAPIYTML
jgi:hypothetical protein